MDKTSHLFILTTGLEAESNATPFLKAFVTLHVISFTKHMQRITKHLLLGQASTYLSFLALVPFSTNFTDKELMYNMKSISVTHMPRVQVSPKYCE